MAGRPTKYTPEAVKIITDAIKEGLSFRDSCAMAGISEDTFADWRKDKADFSEAVEKAVAEFKKQNLIAIRAAGLKKLKDGSLSGSWQANAWLLERRFPQEFGRTVQEQVGKDGGAIKHEHTIDMSKVSDEQLDRILRG